MTDVDFAGCRRWLPRAECIARIECGEEEGETEHHHRRVVDCVVVPQRRFMGREHQSY